MFYENDIINFNILDVLELKYKNSSHNNSGRNFNALSFRINSDARIKTNENEYELGDNSIAYIPARLSYYREASYDELIVVHFDSTNYSTKSIEYFYAAEPEKFEALFRKIYLCWEEKAPGYKYTCSAILNEIFALCYAQNHREKYEKTKIQPSLEFITKNYKNPDITIGEIAKKSFMSEVYFRKLFKEEYGISPQKFITNLRIQNAAGLISSGYYSLGEIAKMSGYNDYKYFSVEFKRVMGVSPSKYTYNY